jgi:hypothetical protein
LESAKPTWDQHPVPGLHDRLLEQADVDRPPHPAHVHLGEVGTVVEDLDDFPGNIKTHGFRPSRL